MAKGVSIGVSYALCGWLVQKYNGPQFGRPKPQRIRERVIFFNSYMVGSLDLVKFFGATGPIYRGELLLNFIIFITCTQYYIQRSIAWYY